VLIQVTLAEISLDTKNELGIDWNYKKGEDNLSTSLLNASLSNKGLNFSIGNTPRWSAALSALASEKKVNILSAPTVLASENKEAKIDISTEVPVPSVEYKNTNDSQVIETNIQYRNTGIILSVTPHINEHGLVSMEINQEISEQSESVPVGDRTALSFYKRSVNTSLTVKDGQTIIIGGLMKEKKDNGTAGMPCLGGLPVMQYFFGKETKSSEKTELIILITPRVIANLDDIDKVTEEFKSKVGNVTEKIEEKP
jgi:general secretion pathway protein D